MKNFIIIITLLIFGSDLTAQQESQFTQFYYAQQSYNPAYVGVRSVPSISLIYRQQWIGYDGAPTSIFAGYNSKFLSDKVGIGIGIHSDNIGIQKTWKGTMAYSYELKVNEQYAVHFGFQGSIKNYRFDFTDPAVVIQQQSDNSVVNGMETNDFTGNFGVGIYAKLDQFFVGASVPNFYPNEIGFNSDNQIISGIEAQHFFFTAGGYFPINNKIKLRPSLLGIYVKNTPFEASLNFTGIYEKRIHLGLGYRVGGTGPGESINLNLMYQVKQIGLGISYDIGLAQVSRSSSGSFEILARYDFEAADVENLANPRYEF